MQLRTVLDVKVVDVEKRRHPSKHYVSVLPVRTQPIILTVTCSHEAVKKYSVMKKKSNVFIAQLMDSTPQLNIFNFEQFMMKEEFVLTAVEPPVLINYFLLNDLL